jgi:UDP-glucose 4-epimerase
MKKILVTGGAGYIGSHTVVDLLQNGYEVISADNFSRSNPYILDGIEKITGKKIKNYNIDLCNVEDTKSIFKENPDILGVIHFAAFKAVGESVENPLLYFNNNLKSLLHILQCCEEFSIKHFVFSSSCTVYGEPDESPVTEETAIKKAASPYGSTKQIGEMIVEQCSGTDKLQSILLRYFNPVGAHPSNEIGEMPIGKPANLVPSITQTAIGKMSLMEVFGSDYPTKDGSCIRDYIHVSDIAHAHTLALDYLINSRNEKCCEVFNLGSGDGYTVLEVIKAFEKVSGKKLNYQLSKRRPGDIIAIFADNKKAKSILKWQPQYSLEEMMSTAWNWELSLNK